MKRHTPLPIPFSPGDFVPAQPQAFTLWAGSNQEKELIWFPKSLESTYGDKWREVLKQDELWGAKVKITQIDRAVDGSLTFTTDTFHQYRWVAATDAEAFTNSINNRGDRVVFQKMLADAAMKTDASRWLVYAAGAATDAGVKGVTKLAAESKCYATDTAMEVATDAVQIFGGYGFMEDYPIAKFFRDAKILQIYEGTNQIQRMVIARNLIKEVEQLAHLDEFIPREEQKAYKGEEVHTGA